MNLLAPTEQQKGIGAIATLEQIGMRMQDWRVDDATTAFYYPDHAKSVVIDNHAMVSRRKWVDSTRRAMERLWCVVNGRWALKQGGTSGGRSVVKFLGSYCSPLFRSRSTQEGARNSPSWTSLGNVVAVVAGSSSEEWMVDWTQKWP